MSETAHPMEEVVLDCLAAADVDAAIDRACGEHAEHASTIRRVAVRLRTLGLHSDGGSAPSQIGPFALRERLGEGGMGVVYRAWQEPPGREVALKVIRPELLHFDGSRARFRREVEASVKLSHPGIVPVHEIGSDDGVPWFSMAFVRGQSLAAALDRLRGRDVATLRGSDLHAEADDDVGTDGAWIDAVLAAVHGIAIALRHAHSRGVLHRDVKPSNIMLAADGRAMLLDFGLAHTDDGQRLTRSHSMLGSLPYMAPEQVRGDGAEPGVEVDIYGLGVTLYEALTLQNPFLGRTAEETRARVVDARPVPPRQLNVRISRDLETVCLTAIAEDPRLRYARIAEFVRDLDAVRAGEPILASPDSWFDRAVRFARRNRILVTATVAVVVALGVGTVVSLLLYLQSEEQRALAEASRDRSDWNAYVASLAGAEEALRAHRAVHAIERLREAPVQFAGWEYRHFASRLDMSRATLLATGSDLTCLAVATGRAACGADDSLRVLDCETGEVLHEVTSTGVRDVAISADGASVAWAEDAQLALLHVASGRVERFAEHGWGCVAFGPDGASLAAGSLSGYLYVFDVAERKPKQRTRVADSLRTVAFAPSGTLIVCGGAARLVRVLEVGGLTEVHTLRGHRGQIEDVAFDGGSATIASASRDGSVRLWSAETGEQIGFPLAHDAAVCGVAFRANDREVVAAAGDSLFRWHARRGLRLGASHGHLGRIRGVAWHGDADFLTVAEDGTLRRWVAEVEDLPTVRVHGNEVADVALSPGGDVITSISRGDGLIRAWRVPGRRLVFDGVSFGLADAVAVCFDPTGRRAAFAGRARVLVFEIEGWSKVCELRSETGSVRSAQFSSDGEWLITGGDEGEPLACWDLATAAMVSRTRVDGAVHAIAVSSDGTRLLLGGSAGSRVLELPDFEPLAVLSRDPCHAIAIRADGAVIATGHADGCRTWWAQSFAPQHVLPGREVREVLFEPDGTRLFTVGADGAIHVWAGDAIAARLRAGNSAVRCLAFDRAGRWLASGDSLGTLRLWPARVEAEVPPK